MECIKYSVGRHGRVYLDHIRSVKQCVLICQAGILHHVSTAGTAMSRNQNPVLINEFSD